MPTIYATGLIDLERHVVIDMVEGNSAADLRRWTANADPGWLAGIEVVATDLAESFRAGLSPHLAHTRRVADPFHVVRVGNRCVDAGPPTGAERDPRPPWPQGRSAVSDPQAAAHRLRTTRPTRARSGCCSACASATRNDELLGAWLAKESVRDVYLADTPADAATLLDKAIVGCAADEVAEIRSLGKTLASWRTEILAHHDTGASNGPTEGLNLCVKKVKRCGHGFRSFEQLPAARPAPRRRHHLARTPRPPRIRTRSPHSNA